MKALNDIQNSVYRTALKLRSVQTLCQLGLTDVSLIQHILPSHQCQREKQSSLTTQQLSQLLKELFQNARLDKPGQVDPKAPELTQNLLTAMYDRTGTGFIKARSAAAALIALSGDSLLTKYKGGKNRPIDILFQVLNSAIGEEKFLSWLQSEPGLLLWLPTCYRLSATEMVMHHVRCSICKNFPITGLRYRCLKCLNFDLCQVCFFTERQSKPHKRSHPVMEYCQMSAKENAKIFFRTVRNNLLQERCRRKEARRRQTLEMMEGGDFPEHEQAPYLRKQLNKWKDKVLLLHNSQEDKSCRLEAKLQALIANHECVQAELQQMRQEIKVQRTMCQESRQRFGYWHALSTAHQHCLIVTLCSPCLGSKIPSHAQDSIVLSAVQAYEEKVPVLKSYKLIRQARQGKHYYPPFTGGETESWGFTDLPKVIYGFCGRDGRELKPDLLSLISVL
uniref:Dystrotelin n=1 Tax=Terrapene triunguis TaxID=2587831 RepID=A0A674HZG7_9SAUR